MMLDLIDLQLLKNGSVTRLKCRKPFTLEEERSANQSSQKRREIYFNHYKLDAQNEKSTVKLEQDRIFHTCHLLPPHILDK